MARKEDYRIIKTKKALTEAFDSLMRTERFEDITVNQLCNTAGVRRATFYKHFDDKLDFLDYVMRATRENFDREVWRRRAPDGTCAYYIKYAETLISYFSENRDIVSGILRSNSSHSIITMLTERNYKDTKDRLDISVREGLSLSVSTETVANILTGGIALAVIRWLEGGMATPKDELIAEITHVIDALLA